MRHILKNKNKTLLFIRQIAIIIRINRIVKKIIINFITNLSLNKQRDNVYNLCLVIINYYIKIILYIFVIKKVNLINFANIIFERVIFVYDTSNDIIMRLTLFSHIYFGMADQRFRLEI